MYQPRLAYRKPARVPSDPRICRRATKARMTTRTGSTRRRGSISDCCFDTDVIANTAVMATNATANARAATAVHEMGA